MPRKYMTVFGVVGLLAATIQIQGQAPAADYTASQAQAGDVAYQNLCASCHLANLAGASDSPQLARTELPEQVGWASSARPL